MAYGLVAFFLAIWLSIALRRGAFFLGWFVLWVLVLFGVNTVVDLSKLELM